MKGVQWLVNEGDYEDRGTSTPSMRSARGLGVTVSRLRLPCCRSPVEHLVRSHFYPLKLTPSRTMDNRKRKIDLLGVGAEEAQPGVIVSPPASQQSALNLYTGRPYSQKYYDILAKRKGAPCVLHHRAATEAVVACCSLFLQLCEIIMHRFCTLCLPL